jgi:hypothetical protein
LGSETLADYALGTDAQKEAVLYDFQKLFSVCGFTPSQLLAWGNWADSSGNLKATIGTSQFAASDRVVCPFSGKYLTLGAGAANANELVYPPYTEPAHTQPLQAWRGSGNDIDLPSAIESPSGEGLIVYRTQKDQSANPAFFLDFVKYGESVNRWPIPLNVPYQFIDAAPVANARGISYNGIAGATAIGDTHVAMPLIPVYDTDGTVKAILCSIYWHSTQRPNVPTTGDRQLDAGVLIVIDDDGQRVVDLVPMPWGSAYTGNEDAYLLGVNTYSLMINRAFKTMIATRSGAATGADILEVMFDPETETTDYKKVINGGGGVLRSYPGQAVIMSDGRMIRCGLYLKVETGASSITGYTAWIVPPAADFADNSKWFAPTGQRLDGTDGISALGSINFLSTNALHLTSDNDAFFPDLPDLSEGMDALFMLHPCHVNGPTFEGMAAVMRISTTNADRSSITSDSNGGAWLPYDKCVIRRWIYTTGSAPTLVEERDELDALVEFDLMPILEAMLPGNWGRDTNFLAAEVTGLSAMQFGTNKMLLFIHDNLTATPGTNLIPTNLNTGHRLRAVLFHDLSAADPTENLEFGEIVFDLATDNSEGYGLYPYFAGSGNDGSKSVCVYVGGGTWASEGYGNRNAHAVDLRTNFRETQPLAIADMVNITNKRVFDEELNSGATSDEEMETYLGLRTVNSEVNDYDWSGFQLGTYAASYNGNGYNHSVPCTLISDTYGISANHNVPVVGAKVWFRTPVGTIVETTVADTTELTLSGSYLVQLDSNPSVLLERYPIVRDASLQRYVAAGGKFWQFYQTLAIKLRECVSLTTHSGLAVVEHADSDWEQGDILSGSGRPAVVPLNDGTLVLIGTAEYGGSGQFHGNNRFSLDFVEIQSTLAASGESANLHGHTGVSK